MPMVRGALFDNAATFRADPATEYGISYAWRVGCIGSASRNLKNSGFGFP
jgi:hypothetical protein